MKIEVLRNIFAKNDDAAAENRERFDEHGVRCINLLGGAGSGKTSILEAVLPKIKAAKRVAVLEGDLATTRDSQRIADLDVPVVQLLTEGGCHLTATIVWHALKKLDLAGLDLLVIENVGNPICPANFDLGEHKRISVLSVTEGDDKPSKYPLLFKDVAAVLITKCDLLEHTDFDLEQAERDLKLVNPGAKVFHTEVRTGRGTEALAAWILERLG